MSTNMTIRIPKELHVAFGSPSPNSPTVYQKEGGVNHAQDWYRALRQVVGDVVALPSVSLFVPVSRNAIHKRVKQGKLSCFKFKISEGDPDVSASLNRERPHAFVPVIECKLWYQEFHDRSLLRSESLLSDSIYLDDESVDSTHISFHASKFSGYWKNEYERLKSEYFEREEIKERLVK